MKLIERPGRWLIILPPLLFLLVFFLIPFAFALKISLAETAPRVPPFTDILTRHAMATCTCRSALRNYRYLLTDEVYGVAYLYSLKTAFFSTLICLALGYPMAYAISRASKIHAEHPAADHHPAVLDVLPAAGLCAGGDHPRQRHAQYRAAVAGSHHQPLKIMRTSLAVYLGIIYSYLPFMVLPLFATLEKLDHTLLEAAADLGSPPWRAFLDVTLPLSIPGVIAGSMLVFIPAIGEFVIPSLLGGPDNLMIGRVLWDEFFGNHDWPVASAVAIAFLVLLVGPIAIYQYYNVKQLER